ncbi:MAG: TonB-dependent receptor [Bryobacterales bacterium]|nr:TonB-dependent receptor [Bryobacterales bacterium]
MTPKSESFLRAVPIAVLLLALVIPLAAQETTGTIRGDVTDPSGAVVPGATVEISGPALMRNQTVTTDSAGNFTFSTLPPGTYEVTVNARGFSAAKRVNIELQVGKVLRLDFRLEVGGTSETVVVMGEAAIVDVSQSTVMANVSAASIDRLPKGRGFDTLIALAPGARYEDKTGGYQVDGASGSENIFLIDGMDLTSVYSGALNKSGNIPFEFVQELQVKSSGFEAQYGGAMGGVINVVTKSGGNNGYHGDVGLFLRTDSMQARPRATLSIDPEDDTKGYYQQNEVDAYRYLSPGFTLGGPVLKDRIWFFAGYYPELTKYEREVTFLSNDATSTFDRKERRDYLNGKLDFAPFSKLRVYGGYIYSPYRVNGNLPARNGSSDPNLPWADRGSRSPAASYTFGGDYMATSKLVLSVRGGYNYTNYKDYGVARGVSVYQNVNSAYPVPAQWKQTYVGYTPGYGSNPYQQRDIQTRFRTSADVSYIFNAGGQHTLKSGWETNQLHMDPFYGSWPDGYIRFYWGATYTGQAARAGEKMKGQYGYIRHYLYGESGEASSDNHALFIQDSWQIHKRLTLQLGLRTEREFVPSFAVGQNIPSKAIEFGFGQKLAPRVGFALDVKGDGRWKVAGSFGLFYDLMKYSLPQGSFGGAIYQMWFYPLDNPDPAFYLSKLQRDADGLALVAPLKDLQLFEHVDWRIPSNDPNDNTIDPDLKPMRRRVWDFSTEYALTPSLALSARFTHNSVDRVIEDVGTLSDAGEKYYISNPGFGITADPKTWGTGFPVTPKAKRNYDALEVRAEKRFSRNYHFSASYTLSRLWGNYSGLASSDELTDGVGRQDPNASRYFDLPWMSYDSHGRLVEGRLATDRPHAFKFFGSYTWKNKLGQTNFGPSFMVMSGTPLTSEVAVISSTPVYVDGRGDLGRTPVYSQTDFLVYHEVPLPNSETRKIRLEANISNLFNQSTVLARSTNLVHPDYGEHLSFEPQESFFKGFDYQQMLNAGYADGSLTRNPYFNWASQFQGPRYIRLGFKFVF